MSKSVSEGYRNSFKNSSHEVLHLSFLNPIFRMNYGRNFKIIIYFQIQSAGYLEELW